MNELVDDRELAVLVKLAEHSPAMRMCLSGYVNKLYADRDESLEPERVRVRQALGLDAAPAAAA